MVIKPPTLDRTASIGSRRFLGALIAMLLLAPLMALTSSPADAQADTPFTAVNFGDSWSYLDDGSDQGTAWQSPSFDDSSWATGASELGYGDGDEATIVSYGPDQFDKFTTTYFRKDFVVPANVQSLEITVVRDDGIVVHINGVEVGIDNLTPTYNYLSYATTPQGAGEADPVTFIVSPTVLVPGTNVIAAEVHQANASSSDLSFNLQMTGTAVASTDTEAPTVPTGLTTTASTSSTISLSWTAATDNVAVQSYTVYRNGVAVGSVTSPSTTYVDTGLESDTGYSYQVTASDAALNESTASTSVFASTTASTTLELSETADNTWQTDGTVHVVLPVGDTVYIGGEFSALNDGNGNSVARNNLAAIDRLTGLPTSFDPNMNGKVFALEPSTDATTLYVGGSFTTADGGVNRKRIAAFDMATGALTDFKPAFPNKSVRAVRTDGTRLFIGGLFDKVGPDARVRLAAYDIATETLDTTWTPTADSAVKSMIVDPTKVWIAGNFEYINGVYAEGLAAVTLDTATLLATDHPGIPILDIAALGDQIFAAGAGPGGTAAAYNRTTGAFQWSKWADGNVQGVAAVGNYAYFGGHYEDIGGVNLGGGNIANGNPVGRITRHDLATGELDLTWLPDVNGSRGVNDVAAEGFSVYLGGDFSFVSGDAHMGFAMFSDKPANETPAALVSMTMLDVDQNGRVDTVEALFDKTLAACSAPCTDGWTLTNAPSGATLNEVSTNGALVTLQLTEGTEALDTAVGGFRVALALPNSIVDNDGLQPSFAATEPADGAAPVPEKLVKTNAGTSGFAESGDTFKIKWSERIDPASLPAFTDLAITDPGDGGNDLLTIPGLVDGSIDLGTDGYIECAGGPCVGPHQATFTASAVTLTSSGTLAVVTLASCSGDCADLASGANTTVTYVAPTSITDVDGNAATGTTTKTFKLF